MIDSRRQCIETFKRNDTVSGTFVAKNLQLRVQRRGQVRGIANLERSVRCGEKIPYGLAGGPKAGLEHVMTLQKDGIFRSTNRVERHCKDVRVIFGERASFLPHPCLE